MEHMDTIDLIAILALVLALLLMLSVFSLKRRVNELESRLAQRDAYGGMSSPQRAVELLTSRLPCSCRTRSWHRTWSGESAC